MLHCTEMRQGDDGSCWQLPPLWGIWSTLRIALTPRQQQRRCIAALSDWSCPILQTRTPDAPPPKMDQAQPAPGSLSWRLSSHPITLLTFLGFRVCECPSALRIVQIAMQRSR